MKYSLFRKAFIRYQYGEIKRIEETERAVRYLVDEKEIRIENTSSGMKFNCTCDHHMKHQLQDKLCSRMIALLIYIYRKEAKQRG